MILAGGGLIAAKRDHAVRKICLYPRSFFEFLEAVIFGTAAEWAVFEILAIPMALTEKSFSLLQWTWVIVMTAGIIFGTGFVVIRNKRAEQQAPDADTVPVIMAGTLNRWGILLLIGVLLLAGFQSYMYITGIHTDWDDSRFLAHALEAYTHGNMFNVSPTTGDYIGLHYWEAHKDIIAPWPLFLALLAKLAGIHPTILAHTFLPPAYLFLTYGVYWLVGKCLFQGNTNRSILFTGLTGFIMLFYYAATHSQAEFILVRLWQGKAVLAAFGIPLIFFVFLRAAEKEVHALWLLVPASTGCCLLSTMTIPILGICIAGCSVCYLLFTRKWKAVLPILTGMAPLLLLALLDMHIR